MNQPKTKVIALRTSNDMYIKLKELSLKYGVTESQMLRWSLDAILEHEKKSGKLSLPLDFVAKDTEKG